MALWLLIAFNACLKVEYSPLDTSVDVLAALGPLLIDTDNNPPSNLSYANSVYIYTLGLPIINIVPTFSGKIDSCVSSPALPAALSLDQSTCTISGTPQSLQPAKDYTIIASNAFGQTSTNINITLNAAPPGSLTYTGTPLVLTKDTPVGTITPTYTGTVASCSAAPALPVGLGISNTTCAISGTPTVLQGATAYTITAGNAFGSTNTVINITINDVPPSSLSYTGSPYTFVEDAAIPTQTPTFSGSVTSCGAAPALPTGLSISNTTCVISGTPITPQSATAYTITASNAYGSTNTSVNFAIQYAAPAGVAANGDASKIAISWSAVAGATSYNIYYKTSSGVSTSDTQISGVSSPYNHSGLTTGTDYYYVVTAVGPAGEGAISSEVSDRLDQYKDNMDGTVTDQENSITWMKCSQGQTWNNGTNGCDGTASSTYQFCDAVDLSCAAQFGNLNGSGNSSAYDTCNALNSTPPGGFAGRTNWRVPDSEGELKTLVYCSNGPATPLSGSNTCNGGSTAPTIRSALFPNTPGAAFTNYWTARSNSVAGAYVIKFDDGRRGNSSKTNTTYVRCVASGL